MSVSVGVKWKLSANLEKLLEDNQDLAHQGIEQGLNAIKTESPGWVKKHITRIGLVDKGRLRSSIASQIKDGSVLVGSDVEYARIHELGGKTKPHVIRPKKKKALYWSGANHPVKKVNHPGSTIKAKYYIRTPINEKVQSGEVESAFYRGLKSVFGGE